MEHFRERLGGHALVGLDTSVFIYHLEAHPRYQPLTQELLSGVQAGRQRAVTSTITVMELTVRPGQVGRAAVAREYEALLIHFPHLTLANVTRAVARRAAQLRARRRALDRHRADSWSDSLCDQQPAAGATGAGARRHCAG